MEYNGLKSVFKNDIIGYLKEKENLKQSTRSQFYFLRTFDEMCFNLKVDNPVLTKTLVLKWLEKNPNENKNNQSKRASIIRCFGKYLLRCDKECYIVPKLLYPVKEKYLPHIYTKDEIKRFFEVVDNLQKKTNDDLKPVIMPIIYRILLFTGMRINEILSLKIRDINFKDNLIIIKNAKNYKDRLISISNKLCNRILNYHYEYNDNLNDDSYFFRNSKNNKISVDSFYEFFRTYLWKANIHHTGKGPRVHDFRHTFTINCIEKWLIEGKNIKVLLPILQTYLGHETVEATYYYYHLTLGLYPYLEEKILKINENIIPTLSEDGDLVE